MQNEVSDASKSIKPIPSLIDDILFLEQVHETIYRFCRLYKAYCKLLDAPE